MKDGFDEVSSGKPLDLRGHAAPNAYVPKPMTSNSPRPRWRYSKAGLVYLASDVEYRCPAVERLHWRQTTEEKGLRIHARSRAQCTTGKELRVCRWEHEEVIDRMHGMLRVTRSR